MPEEELQCWYDRRLDPLNFKVDRFCGLSTNAGATWTNTPQTLSNWLPIHATDFILDSFYMGDYDGVASDFTKTNSGFINASSYALYGRFRAQPRCHGHLILEISEN